MNEFIIKEWDDFDFWQSGEWQKIQEDLDDLDRKRISYNPKREDIFAALDAVSYPSVRVAIIGQDPYPDARFCTGKAFSIPATETDIPASLATIFQEYQTDLHLPLPSTGDLEPWIKQGVLMWNCVPTCYTGKAGSHRDWNEWEYLTDEIVKRLSERPIVFVFVGSIAAKFDRNIQPTSPSKVLYVAHPSPLARNAKSPFRGSRIFSTINAKLCELEETPINWRLPDGTQSKRTDTHSWPTKEKTTTSFDEKTKVIRTERVLEEVPF